MKPGETHVDPIAAGGSRSLLTLHRALLANGAPGIAVQIEQDDGAKAIVYFSAPESITSLIEMLEAARSELAAAVTP